MKFYNTREAATVTGKHPKTVTIALNSGELRGYQRGKGSHWMIEDVDLRAWVVGAA